MTVKEVLIKATQFLNIDEELSSDLALDTISSNNRQLVTLFNASLLAYEELATDYFPLLKRESVVIENNKLYYDDLTKTVKDIYRIGGIDGKIFRFKCYPDYCYVAGEGNVDVTYSYVPVAPTFAGAFDNFCGKVSVRSFALLTAAEYCFINGFYEDAKIWHKRFSQSIKANMSSRAHFVMPKRKWL